MATKDADYIKKMFTDTSGNLVHALYQENQTDRSALGADYAQLTKSALDLHETTKDAKWLTWATSLHNQLAKNLTSSPKYFISESDGADYPYPFNIYQAFNILQIDNTCTWALEYANIKRLNALQEDPALKDQSSALLPVLLGSLKISPLVNIDYLTEETKLKNNSAPTP